MESLSVIKCSVNDTLSGINQQNLADTRPAATRVLSLVRKREEPGKEVDQYSRVHSYLTFV